MFAIETGDLDFKQPSIAFNKTGLLSSFITEQGRTSAHAFPIHTQHTLQRTQESKHPTL